MLTVAYLGGRPLPPFGLIFLPYFPAALLHGSMGDQVWPPFARS